MDYKLERQLLDAVLDENRVRHDAEAEIRASDARRSELLKLRDKLESMDCEKCGAEFSGTLEELADADPDEPCGFCAAGNVAGDVPRCEACLHVHLGECGG